MSEENEILTEEQASAEISKLVDQAYANLRKAEEIADKFDLSFSFDVEYGMGGYYEDGEWTSSSSNC